MTITELQHGDAGFCREVLHDLPEWFGQAEATTAYVEAVSRHPMLICHREGERAGFVSLKSHTVHATELYVLGVKRRCHRHGVGRAMIQEAVKTGAAKGLRYLTVKTLASDSPDPHYAATRHFYEAMGFVPIEIFPTLWRPDHPCLLMIRPV